MAAGGSSAEPEPGAPWLQGTFVQKIHPSRGSSGKPGLALAPREKETGLGALALAWKVSPWSQGVQGLGLGTEDPEAMYFQNKRIEISNIIYSITIIPA